MKTAQLRKAGLVIAGLGVAALVVHLILKENLYLYIGIGATALGVVVGGIGILKK